MDPLRTLDFQARWVVSRGGGSYLNGSPPWRSGPMWYCEGGTTSQGGPGRSKRHIFFNGNCLFQFENVGGDSPFSEELLRLLGLPILYLHWMEGFQISKMFFIILYSFYKNHKILRTYIWSQDADSLLARHQQEMMTFFLDWGNPYSINLYFATGILEGGGVDPRYPTPLGDVRSPNLPNGNRRNTFIACVRLWEDNWFVSTPFEFERHPPLLKLWKIPILKNPSTGSISSPRDLVFMMWEWEGQQKHISRFFLLNHNSVF